MPAEPGRCERFARAVPVARPATRYELYLCALATFASGPGAGRDGAAGVRATCSAGWAGPRWPARAGAPDLPGPPPRLASDDLLAEAARAAQEHPGPPPGPLPPGADGTEGDGPGWPGSAAAEAAGPDAPDRPESARPALASRVERLAGTDFAELTPGELQALTGLMSELTLAVPAAPLAP